VKLWVEHPEGMKAPATGEGSQSRPNLLNSKTSKLSEQYLRALSTRLQGGTREKSPPRTAWLGRQAIDGDLATLDLAEMHETALVALIPKDALAPVRDGTVKQAGIFFLEVLTAIEKTRWAALDANGHLKRVNATLSRRTIEVTNANRNLKKEIVQRRAAEKALKRSEHHHQVLLKEARLMQQQMRHLSHRILSAQEEERKEISRELHDEITQTLAGINVHLATLKEEATLKSDSLRTKVSITQRLVEKSIKIVHRFARDLRPTALDDLGLIPAVKSYMEEFTRRTGVRTRLDVFAEVEKLAGAKRTVLYRVTQAALTNVAQHAEASLVKVGIRKFAGGVRLKITDDGKSFDVGHVLRPRKNKRLGLLGMRERVEMVGGHFSVQSSVKQGTTIQAQIPFSWDNHA
jgi:two-component system sensor histidine kinase DegS